MALYTGSSGGGGGACNGKILIGKLIRQAFKNKNHNILIIRLQHDNDGIIISRRRLTTTTKTITYASTHCERPQVETRDSFSSDRRRRRRRRRRQCVLETG